MSTLEIVLAIIGGYAALHIGLAFAMRGPRLRLAKRARQLLARPDLSEKDRDRVEHLLDTCMSFKVAFLIPIAAIAMVLEQVLGDPDPEEGNPEVAHLVVRYLASVMAANPVFGALAAIILAMCLLAANIIQAVRGSRPWDVGTLRRVMGGPLYRASHAVD